MEIAAITREAKYPSYAADLWKSKAKQYYVAVTFQFINEEWQLVTIPIALRHILGQHTKQAVGKLIAECLQPYLGEGVFPFGGVIDGGDIASIGETAISLQCSIHGHTCICHILNNAIRRIFEKYLENNYLQKWPLKIYQEN